MTAPRTSAASTGFVAGRPHWWEWGTILSLDAPVVAVLWQWQLAAMVGARLAWHHTFLLGLLTWMVYAADRWIEGFSLVPAQVRTQRHWFYQCRRWPTFVAWCVVVIVALDTAVRHCVPIEWKAGAVLAPLVLVYLLSHQLAHRTHAWRVPKEVCIAVLFASGTACLPFLHAEAPTSRLLWPTAGFALLCFANCALISAWEEDVDRAHGQTSLVLQFPASRSSLRVLPWGIAVVAAALAWHADDRLRTALLAVVTSGVSLGALDLWHTSLGRRLARVLADVALMTPLVSLLGGWC